MASIPARISSGLRTLADTTVSSVTGFAGVSTPSGILPVTASATICCWAASPPNALRMFCEILYLQYFQQNFGPHIEQKCAILAGSAGSVSSWKAMAVSGS